MKEVCEKPTARIAVKKNVVKIYEDQTVNKVFLKDGTEFEIELFNPTRDVILCKFKINGKFTNDNGLILQPGQRVFLERYLDEDKKFLFSTYEVDNTPEALQAIYDNGRIEVSFYKEVANNWTITYTAPNIEYYGTHIYYSGSSTTTGGVSGFSCSDATQAPIQNAINTVTSTGSVKLHQPNDSVTQVSYNLNRPEKETGRVEKGSKSNQLLGYANRYFNNIAFHKVEVKILPDNEKIYEVNDIKHKKYCSECGSKLKPNDKYCSQCGHKV